MRLINKILIEMVYAEGDNRFKSYCLMCQIGKSGKEENVGFIDKHAENGKEPGPLFSKPETTELLTVTDNYYKTQNNGLHNSISFLIFLFIYLFCN